MQGPRLVQSLLDVADQSTQAEQTYGKSGFGFRLKGFSKELAELKTLAQSEDPADQTKAAQLAQTIAGGIKSNLTPPQMTARINSWLKLIGKYSPGDKNYDAKAHEAAVKLGIESELPSGGTGLAEPRWRRRSSPPCTRWWASLASTLPPSAPCFRTYSGWRERQGVTRRASLPSFRRW
jgi:hypothetical protein